MNCPIPYKVVNAQEHGLDQHSPFTWEVNDECNDFPTQKSSPMARNSLMQSSTSGLPNIPIVKPPQLLMPYSEQLKQLE